MELLLLRLRFTFGRREFRIPGPPHALMRVDWVSTLRCVSCWCLCSAPGSANACGRLPGACSCTAAFWAIFLYAPSGRSVVGFGPLSISSGVPPCLKTSELICFHMFRVFLTSFNLIIVTEQPCACNSPQSRWSIFPQIASVTLADSVDEAGVKVFVRPHRLSGDPTCSHVPPKIMLTPPCCRTPFLNTKTMFLLSISLLGLSRPWCMTLTRYILKCFCKRLQLQLQLMALGHPSLDT